MVKLIPLMGHGTVGKDYVYKILCHSPSFEGMSSYIDTSDSAKAMLTKIRVQPNQAANENFQLSTLEKTDNYRRALVNIIKAFDELDIRLYETMDRINKILSNRSYGEQPLFFIFINVRDVEFVAKLADIYKPLGIETFPLIITGENSYKNTELDSKEYEDSIIPKLKYYDIEFARYENQKSDDPKKANAEITKFAEKFKKTLLSR